MINDFLNKSPVFKPSIGVNLNQQRLFPRSAGERRRRRTGREKDLLERRKAEGKKKKKKSRRKKTKRGAITLTADCCSKCSLPAGGGVHLAKKRVPCNGLGNTRARPFTRALPLAAAGTRLPTCSQALAIAALTAERLLKKKKKKI